MNGPAKRALVDLLLNELALPVSIEPETMREVPVETWAAEVLRSQATELKRLGAFLDEALDIASCGPIECRRHASCVDPEACNDARVREIRKEATR